MKWNITDKKKIRKPESSVQDLLYTIKWPNTSVLGVPEIMEKQNGLENLLSEVTAENFPIQAREAQNLKHITGKKAPRPIVAKENIKVLKCVPETADYLQRISN